MFRLPKDYYSEMVAQAQAEDPNECCGILAGANGDVVKLYRARNADASPYHYSVDPQQLLQIHRELDQNNWDLLAVYHSHTHTRAYPSPTDIGLAFYPDAYYIIISLQDKNNPLARAFRIVDGQVSEEDLVIT